MGLTEPLDLKKRVRLIFFQTTNIYIYIIFFVQGFLKFTSVEDKVTIQAEIASEKDSKTKIQIAPTNFNFPVYAFGYAGVEIQAVICYTIISNTLIKNKLCCSLSPRPRLLISIPDKLLLRQLSRF